MELSELLPHGAIADDHAGRSMNTGSVDHESALRINHTDVPGRAADLWSWVLYGLGSENENLPAASCLRSGWPAGDGSATRISPPSIKARCFAAQFARLQSQTPAHVLPRRANQLALLKEINRHHAALRRIPSERAHRQLRTAARM
jgi:hypothetical protein